MIEATQTRYRGWGTDLGYLKLNLKIEHGNTEHTKNTEYARVNVEVEEISELDGRSIRDIRETGISVDGLTIIWPRLKLTIPVERLTKGLVKYDRVFHVYYKQDGSSESFRFANEKIV
jgi:hypothetical protein